MRSRAALMLRIIDLLGGCMVAACLLGAIFLVFVRNDQTKTEIAELTALIRTAQRDARALETARERQHELLANRRAELAASGQLPARPPIERYFGTLSALASKHGLRVVGHNPLGEVCYAGLLESRYAYEVAGAAADLMRFLKSIEDTEFWADVSYLKVDRGGAAGLTNANQRTAVLTISLFSAPPPEQNGAKSKGA